MKGEVGVLNVGVGDTKLSFDPKNPAERIRAARIVRDMLRRGYALLVEVERDGQKVFTRALDFDESVCEYVIADFDPTAAAPAGASEAPHAQEQGQAGQDAAAPGGAKGGEPKRRVVKRSVKADSVRSVAVAPSAGG